MEQNYSAIEKTINLVAKTGLYFASVDGDYSQAERNFIENYKARLSQVGPMNEVQYIFDHVWDHPVTLQEVINETRELLDMMPAPADKQAIVASLAGYIQHVIMADGVEHPDEREALITWMNALA